MYKEYGHNNIHESEYVKNRMTSSRDDRCDKDKQSADAWLRGRLGCSEANKIIEMIDDYKSRR